MKSEMKLLGHLLILNLLLIILANVLAVRAQPSSSYINYHIDNLNRSSFPAGFTFGMVSSAYQTEGAWSTDGRGPSIWDHYAHKYPEKIKDGSNGDVATDFYHRYKEDIQFLKDLNIDSFKFSISWSRILPKGKISGGVNQKGIEFYNNVIDHILANGMTPMITISHFDTPLALEEEYGGFLSPEIVKDYREYADLCFKMFGDRVKHWVTLNEPWVLSWSGYEIGVIAPGRCSAWMNKNCTGGDSGIEPYLVGHHQLLCHASAVSLYKTNYKDHQKGEIGISLLALWTEPYSNSSEDLRAVLRNRDFNIGWFLNPLVYGDYPSSMRTLVGSRLPYFTAEESKLINGSYDFIGINYYTAFYVRDTTDTDDGLNKSPSIDSKTALEVERDGKLIGKRAASAWINVYPKGIYKALKYIQKKYQNPIIYITENGIDNMSNETLPLEWQLKDEFRIKFFHIHLRKVLKAIKNGVRVKGFYAWTPTDNYEWVDGYTVRFGINYVDFKDGQKRYPRLSAKWFQRFLQKQNKMIA